MYTSTKKNSNILVWVLTALVGKVLIIGQELYYFSEHQTLKCLVAITSRC